jgi:hypothetical protein
MAKKKHVYGAGVTVQKRVDDSGYCTILVDTTAKHKIAPILEMEK